MIGGRNVDQVLTPPSHPPLGIARRPQNAVAHFVWPNSWIFIEKQGRIRAVNFFEANKLLTILTARNQVSILAAGPTVDARLSLPHNLEVETRVQDPAS